MPVAARIECLINLKIMCCCNQNNFLLNEDFIVYGTQFTSATDYANQFLQGRFRLKLRGMGDLIKGIEWDVLETGGFKILIPSFAVTNDVVIIGQFY